MINKQEILDAIVNKLQGELISLVEVAKSTHAAATHEESRAEDKHDTLAIEASYLAGAQANRVAELEPLIMMYKFLNLRQFQSNDAIGPSALVELQSLQTRSFYFLVAKGGGLSVIIHGKTVHVITASTPLGEALVGQKKGDTIEVEAVKSLKEYNIINVW